MLVEEALPRAVVSRRDCVDGWKHTIQAPVDEGAGHTAELAASIGHVEEAVDLLASGSAVAHVEFIDHEVVDLGDRGERSEEHTSELQSLMRISYAVFCLKKKKTKHKPSTQKNYLKATKHK